MKLRNYQGKLKSGINGAFEERQNVLALLATGGGKTVLFASIMADVAGGACAVVHRKEIIAQISLTLARAGVYHRIIAPPAVQTRIRRRHLKKLGKSFIDPNSRNGVASAQTIASKATQADSAMQSWLASCELAVFDEAHHYINTGSWAKAVDAFPHSKRLFVTACAKRADGKGLGAWAAGYAQVLIEGPSTRWLIEQGYLSNFEYRAPATDLDLRDIPVTASGDLNMNVMRARVTESHIVGDVVQHYKQFASGKQAIVFATDVKTSDDIAEAFRSAGISALSVNGGDDDTTRNSAVDSFEAGETHVLVNVDLFDEGFDVPGVDCVIKARPTTSLNKYLQQIGRALRPVYADGHDLETQEGRLAAIAAGGKPRAIIIDMVRNWERVGTLPDWPQKWSLNGETKRQGADRPPDTIPLTTCLECTQPFEKFYTSCPYCGAALPEPEGRATPAAVNGDLVALDVDAMRELLASMQRGEMSDEDYKRDQLARHIPAVGRGADLKRHKENRHRRRVLKQLLRYWFGCQPSERELSEKYKRFYYRFGVDAATAMTLKAADVDKLIEQIKERFHDDL